METKFNQEDKQLIFYIFDEIDENYTVRVKSKMDYEIEHYMPKEVVIDLEKVSFMDSAGIGLIVGRYKLTNIIGAELKITNVNNQLKKIFDMSGISKLIPIVQTIGISEE